MQVGYNKAKALVPLTCIWCLSVIVGFVWRQLELAFFGAVTSVAALFVFTERKIKTKGRKKKNEKETSACYCAYTYAYFCACFMRQYRHAIRYIVRYIFRHIVSLTRSANGQQ